MRILSISTIFEKNYNLNYILKRQFVKPTTHLHCSIRNGYYTRLTLIFSYLIHPIKLF